MGVQEIDFAVLGNAPETLAWLRESLAMVPGVCLVGEPEPAPRRLSSAHRNGLVIDGFVTAEGGVVAARRTVVVLEDPVLLSDAVNPECRAPGKYAEQLRYLIDAGRRTLILTTAELRSPPRVHELFDHLQLPAAKPLPAPPPAQRARLSPGRRTLLFGRVRDDIEELERLAGRMFPGWRFGSEPSQEPAETDATLLFYTGRRADAESPRGWLTLDEWDVRPVALGRLLDAARYLTVLDPMSFPFDAMRAGDWAMPMAVCLPDGWDGETLLQLLGRPVLRHLTPLDRVAIDDDAAWEHLRGHFGWPLEMRAPASRVLTGLRPRAGHPARANKAAYVALSGLLRPYVESARGLIPPAERPQILCLAGAVGLWASLLSFREVDLLGVSDHIGELEKAARGFPEWTFTAELPSGPEAAETIHAAVCILALCDLGEAERRALLEGIVHVLRVGGVLILVDRFLEGAGGRSTDAPGPRRLLSELQQAWGRNAVLEHVETLRLPGDDLTSVGLFMLSKLGRPRRL